MSRPLATCALLLMYAPAAGAAPRQARWDELAALLTGKSVSIAMPGGAAITGKATAVAADALLVQVTRTSDPKAYPKGELRVPRASLTTVELHQKGHKYRVIGTVIGTVGGLAVGVVAAVAVGGGFLRNDHPAGSAAAAIGLTAGGAAGGYLLGNAADRRQVIIQIVQ